MTIIVAISKKKTKEKNTTEGNRANKCVFYDRFDWVGRFIFGKKKAEIRLQIQ